MLTLRPNQIAAADAVEDAFRAGINRPLVDSCVGSGKSLIMAEVARRAIVRGERVIIGAHTRELVEQNASACRALGLQVGINAAALNERCWRAPVISAAIQSVYKNAASFGPIALFLGDEAHLWPHAESGMYRSLIRDLSVQRAAGFSGTVFRLQGGSLVEGEAAPFDKVVYRYSILDGIRDEYLVPAFSAPAQDKIDATKLKTRQGEFTGDSQDAQMLALMDNHVAQMIAHGAQRRAWLVFEASTKAAKAMTARLKEWGIPTGLVLGETPGGERSATIAAYRAGRLRCLVNVAALCLDSETEILTSDGFVGMNDMTRKHMIAAWKEDGGVEYAPPKLIVRRDLMPHERMIRIGGKHNPQIRVTSNHRMVVRCGGGLWNTKVIAADEFLKPQWRSIPSFGACEPELLFAVTPEPICDRATQVRANSYNYRKNGVSKESAKLQAETHADRSRAMRYTHPHQLTLEECELIGFWLGDGTKSGGRVSLAQADCYPDTIDRIHELLKMTGICHSWRRYPPNRIGVHGSIRWTLARGTGGRGQETTRGYFSIEPYLEKNGTCLFRGLNRAQLLSLLHGFWMADGLHHAKHRRPQIAGTQKSLYDLLQSICVVRGINATVRKAGKPRNPVHSQQYIFSWASRESWRIHGSHTIEEPYKQQKVWCVTSSTSYLICRRRGKVFVTGNTTGFDVQEVDMLVMRRRTKSLGLYIQMCGRLLRTIGGNLEASIAAGKSDGLVLDFAGNIDAHGPLDFLRPKDTAVSLVSCESCGKRNSGAARNCWYCDEPMTKLCPACLVPVVKGTLDCPHCAYDMRTGGGGEERKPAQLLETPSGAALIASYRPGTPREGGWIPVTRVWRSDAGLTVRTADGQHQVEEWAAEARWIRLDAAGAVSAVLVPNGSARNTAIQVSSEGASLVVPMPQQAAS